MPNVPGDRESIAIQPFPSAYQLGELLGVTAITRHWDDGDERRCRLCEVCTALRGVCTVLTEEAVTEGVAPLYSSLGLDFEGVGEEPVRIRPPFGLAR